MPRILTSGLLVGWFLLPALCPAQNVTNYEVIPDPFLFLLREPAVQRDLALTRVQKSQLVALNERFDGDLLASRNLSPEKAEPRVAKVMSASRDRIAELLDARQQERLRQISYRVRGISFVLLPDAAAHLEITAQQQERIEGVLRDAAQSIGEFQRQLRDGQTTHQKANEGVAEIKKSEQLQVLEQLSAEQRKKLLDLIGPTFDPGRLGQVSFRAPELAGDQVWMNSPPLRLEQLRGKVVVVHFWAFGCINCIRNYPWYRDWYDKYSDQGVVIIGVHTPETATEREVDRLRQKVQEQSLKFPVVVDNDKQIWNAWGNSIWPSVYLIDKQGRLRYWWYGELNWQGAGGQETMAQRIEELLAESA